jgi:hypothetical protein
VNNRKFSVPLPRSARRRATIQSAVEMRIEGLQSFDIENLDASAPIPDQAPILQFHIPDHVRAAGTPELPGNYPSASRSRETLDGSNQRQ